MQNLSKARIYRIKCQGFSGYSDEDVSQLAFANKFPVVICATLLAIGVALASIPILSFLLLVSFLSLILPYNPFDYLYNFGVRKLINKPFLPPRSRQFKFACTLATLWISLHIFLFAMGYTTAGYISGGLMFCVPFLVATIDLCIPSMIYNYLFNVKIE
ncbi:DUF4395 family protein [Mangrovibacterium diazotrophicum]|uniref:Uncharacterized protein DUF4395 n=1 Tax=Mangrovibacterium diazotrophicum TaxID=1261403 RepID=A0A419VUP7_9BACT|nr:DUF4395 family protein [Mangrovibacterium diazotrophicum]RKD85073.1 uncharacterized protein DUF4395 [Mangrovibacterium diazotrophicum]